MAWQTFTAIDAAQGRLDREINKSGVLLVTGLVTLFDPRWVEDPARQQDLQATLRGFLQSPGASQVLDLVAYDAKGQAVTTATGRQRFDRTLGRPVEDRNAAEAGVQIVELVYEGMAVRSFSRSIPRGPSSQQESRSAGRLDVHLSAAEIEVSRRDLATAMTKVSITACLIAALGALLLSSFLARPIRALVKDMKQVSLGDLEHQSKVRSSDELGDLAHAFNVMTASLKAAQEAKLAQREMEHELAVATRIQTRLLPSDIPPAPGFDIARHYASAREVGGDYYDFIRIDEGHLGFVVADVSGKGIPASLIMTMTRSLLRMAAKGETSPVRPVELLNRFLTPDMNPGMFVTLTYCILDLETHEMRLVRAGHNPPLLFSAKQGKLLVIQPRGMGVGIDREGSRFASELQLQRFVLRPGDVLVTYTDGIVEGKDGRDRSYSDERFREVVQANAHLAARDLVAAVVQDLTQHERGTEPSDDVTLIVVKGL